MPPRSIGELRALLDASTGSDAKVLVAELARDPREGARHLARRWLARQDALLAEERRLTALMARQVALHQTGVRLVAGLDEVGRGALAGPVTVAAVVLDATCRIEGLDDSKRLSPEKRARIAGVVRERARAYAIVHVPASEIDTVGIAAAVRLGMERSLAALGEPVDHALVDGNDARLTVPCTAVVGGDHLCACIAAASVIAKVEHDALMVELGADLARYGLAVNKGYGTPEHLCALVEYGPSPIHRRSFAPCSQGPLF
jgi:ribonuclease HII